MICDQKGGIGDLRNKIGENTNYNHYCTEKSGHSES